MSRSSLDKVTVLGAGVLGGQIGWHSAFKGKTVVIYDPFPDALRKAKVAHDTYAQIYRAQLGASDADIAATRARLQLSTRRTCSRHIDIPCSFGHLDGTRRAFALRLAGADEFYIVARQPFDFGRILVAVALPSVPSLHMHVPFE